MEIQTRYTTTERCSRTRLTYVHIYLIIYIHIYIRLYIYISIRIHARKCRHARRQQRGDHQLIYTVYCIWSVISPMSKVNRLSSSWIKLQVSLA